MDELDFTVAIRKRESLLGQCFQEMGLEGLNAENANLSGASISASSFEDCSFNAASFNDCTLSKVIFKNCFFEHTDFSDLDAESLYFYQCKFRTANFKGSVFSRLHFEACTGQLLFRDCEALHASFIGSRLVASDFSSSDLTAAVFRRCDLTGARTDSKSRLDNAVFEDTIITNMDVSSVIGLDSIDFSTAIVKPYVGFGPQPMTSSCTASPPPPRTLDLGIYQGRSLQAKLYCSDVTELRSVK